MSTTIRPGEGGPLSNYAPAALQAPWENGYTYRTRVEVGGLLPGYDLPPTHGDVTQGAGNFPPIIGPPAGTELERGWLALVNRDGRFAVKQMIQEAQRIADDVAPVGAQPGLDYLVAQSVGDALSATLASQDPVTAGAKARTLLLQSAAFALINTRLSGGAEQAGVMADVIGKLAIAATGIARETHPPSDILLDLSFGDLDRLRQVISAIGPQKRSLTARLMTGFSFGKEAALSTSGLAASARRLVVYVTAYSLIKTR